MDRAQAARLVRDTFQNPFDKDRYTGFIRNLLNHLDWQPFAYRGNLIPDAFQRHISQLERIGKYSDGDHALDVLIVTVKTGRSMEQARSMQRNCIARYLNGSRGGTLKDAALVAFVSPDYPDWRFSLIKMEYKIEQGKTDRIKVREELTPARRWSFLVGKNEDTHTAQSRLAPILADDSHDPTLRELEEVFSIEKVTNEFFEEYRGLFIRVKEELDRAVEKNSQVRKDFEAKRISTVDFAKKLLGQLVFLYFLQKKGWFGVARDGAWGSGSRHFLRELHQRKHGEYKNFFNDILEPLFYEALRLDRGHDDDYYGMLKCRIPFLNGGLFDPVNGYDWVHTDLLLPDTLFSNDEVKRNGDRGDGILDVFDRYNFTVKEDEPLEKEVAIDPEMLGKVFEKLGAITPDRFDEWAGAVRSGNRARENEANKKLGVYYTRREIVHYMCRQGLIHYLERELGHHPVAYQKVGEAQLDMFGNEVKAGQLDITMSHPSGPVLSRNDIEKLVHYGEQVVENEIVALEKKQRIEDGRQKSTGIRSLLPESIVKHAGLVDDKLANIRILDPAIGSGAFPVGMMTEIIKLRTILSAFLGGPPANTYEFKRRCIQNCLYGVDIDPGAVEIAKLRLWLSLVVDEEDMSRIKPLPNLDYKILCGNSLEKVEGRLEHSLGLHELELLKKSYFDETNPKQRKEERTRIEELISSLTGGGKRFDFKIFFSEVFASREGFDIVIANPPYVRQETIKDMKKALKGEFGKFFCGTADLYTYFYKRGLEVLKPGGHLCFIAPNKFMRASYGENTRRLLTAEARPKIIIDFGDLPIFEATTYPSIILVEKRRPEPEEKTQVATFGDPSELEDIEKSLTCRGFPTPISALKKEGWVLERPGVLALMEKLRAVGTPLGEYVKGRFYRGILTGLNEAFVIDAATRDRLIAEDPKSAELIKPWLRGRDIKRWKVEWDGLHLIAIASSANREWPWSDAGTEGEARALFEKTYPSVFRHLSQWEERLRRRDDQGQFWWELRSCVYYHEFEEPKIVYPDIAQATEFTYDERGYYLGNTAYILPTEKIWLTGLLNSRLIWWFYLNLSSTIRGGFVRFISQYMELLPIPLTSDVRRAAIATLVQHILDDPSAPAVPRLEADIDRLVYELYGLTPEEIALVEGVRETR